MKRGPEKPFHEFSVVCAPGKVSFASSHQPSPLNLLTMVSQKAAGAVRERGSLGTGQQLLNLLLGVPCQKGNKVKNVKQSKYSNLFIFRY